MSEYGFCGLDERSLRRSLELRALGGGEARVCRMRLVAVCLPAASHPILSPLRSSVGLRDVFAPSDAPASQ